jgi:hypothetical protein
MALANITYRVEITTFPGPTTQVENYSEASDVETVVRGLPPGDRVLFVAALDLAEGEDWGNFYLFTNHIGRAHVMLHEHREFLPQDPLTPDGGLEVAFLDEEGESFSVPDALTTSTQRGVSALVHWLPRQEHWPEFQWE